MKFALRVTNAPLPNPIWIEDYRNPFKVDSPRRATLFTLIQAIHLIETYSDPLELVNENELSVYLLMES